MKFFLLSLVSILLHKTTVESFTNTAAMVKRNTNIVLGSSATDEASKESSAAVTKKLKPDRYIASNRFAVRAGKEAKFEKRWANRKSRLAELDGFKYFHLMRRVTLDEKEGVKYDGGKKKDMQGNYVSLTVWQNKSNFNAWRKGDAFREAHGGTSVGAFVSTMVSSIRILKGAPKPAPAPSRYLHVSSPTPHQPNIMMKEIQNTNICRLGRAIGSLGGYFFF